MRIVDSAVLPEKKSSPNVTMYALVGMLAGFAVSCVVVIILKLRDNSITSEDYLINNYKTMTAAEQNITYKKIIKNILYKRERGYNSDFDIKIEFKDWLENAVRAVFLSCIVL